MSEHAEGAPKETDDTTIVPTPGRRRSTAFANSLVGPDASGLHGRWAHASGKACCSS